MKSDVLFNLVIDFRFRETRGPSENRSEGPEILIRDNPRCYIWKSLVIRDIRDVEWLPELEKTFTQQVVVLGFIQI